MFINTLLVNFNWWLQLCIVSELY